MAQFLEYDALIQKNLSDSVRHFRLQHITEYSYNAPVSTSFGRGYITPRETEFQTVLDHEVNISPQPGDFSEGSDYFGNKDIFFAIFNDHEQLRIDAHSVVRVHDPSIIICSQACASDPWENSIINQVGRKIPEQLHEFSMDTSALSLGKILAKKQEIIAYTRQFFAPNRSIIESLLDFNHHIFTEFTYTPGSTSVSTPVSEVFAKKQGVCQDFARLALTGLRGIGLAAQYVSGYIATDPPPGKERIIGADATHAWARLWIKNGYDSGIWVDFDPTNDQLVNNRYITTGWGRDYSDLSPLKGIIYTDSTKSEINVSVDVCPIDNPLRGNIS